MNKLQNYSAGSGLPSASSKCGWHAFHPSQGRNSELFLRYIYMCSAWSGSSLKACGDPGPRAIQWLGHCEQEILPLVLTFLTLCPLLDRGLGWPESTSQIQEREVHRCDNEENNEILSRLKKKICTFQKANNSSYPFWVLTTLKPF